MCDQCESNAKRYKQTLEEFKIIGATYNCVNQNLGEVTEPKGHDFKEYSVTNFDVDLRGIEMKKISSGLGDQDLINEFMNTTESKSQFPSEEVHDHGIQNKTDCDVTNDEQNEDENPIKLMENKSKIRKNQLITEIN